MTLECDYQEFRQLRGISLSAIGQQDFGFYRSDALHAVSLLENAGIPILGGDVYEFQTHHIRPAYSNWHVDRVVTESSDDFAIRSWDATRLYIAGYPEPVGWSPIFVFVVL